MFSRPVDGTSIRQYLGRAFDAQAVSTIGGSSRFVVYGRSVTVLSGAGGRVALVSRLSVQNVDTDSVLLTTKRDAYVTWYGGLAEVSLASGRVVRQLSLAPIPYVAPTREEFVGADPNSVRSVIVDGGQLFALEDNTESSAIVNLTTGGSRILRGVALLADGVLATDGYVYAFAWDPGHTRMSVLRINPVTLRVVSTYSVPTYGGLTFDRVQMQALRGGGVVIFVTTSSKVFSSKDHGYPIHNFLWEVNDHGFGTLLLPRLGLDMSVFGNDVYIYGGASGNEVSTVNLTTGVSTRDVTRFTTAVGTHIDALV
jgi:hypothetical protein